MIGRSGPARMITVGAASTPCQHGMPAMKAAVITFPGSNCDRDLSVAFAAAGFEVSRVWHKDTVLPDGVDLVGVPGGFSFGDYLRCGAIARFSPMMQSVIEFAIAGGKVFGVCNGFQILCESHLLPGALLRNGNQQFVCKNVFLTNDTDKVYKDKCDKNNDKIKYIKIKIILNY